VTDPVHAYVYDASMQSLDTVNMILCLMEQTRASDMVNQGAYIALVNGNYSPHILNVVRQSHLNSN